MITVDSAGVPDQPLRARLKSLLSGIRPWDDQERTHLAETAEWITSGAPLYTIYVGRDSVLGSPGGVDTRAMTLCKIF
ncbi:hypothetical protein ACWGKQ_08560 [Streptomyces sp. NPDC054770]